MILGHQKQWQFLRKSAEIERIPHGFLFFGQAQLGKKKIALEFIKLLNCQADLIQKRPCQTCRSCRDIENGRHLDFLLIKPQGKEIQISQIRDLSQRLSLKPYQSSFKAVILDQAHLMNQEAQGALLKTLEEPKGKALLILITEYPEILFPTILSRVQKIKFHLVERKEIEDYLSQKGCPQDKIKLISSISFGKPGVAINLLSNPEKLELEHQKLIDLIKIITSNSDLVSRFQYAKRIVQQVKQTQEVSEFSQSLNEILESWLRCFRELLLIKSGAVSNPGIYPDLQKIIQKYSLKKIREILETFQKIIFFLSTTNINPRLTLEMLMLEL